MMSEKIISGTVFCGSMNIFTVKPDPEFQQFIHGSLECRIKGKILKSSQGFYNPLAPGDRVYVEYDLKNPNAGMITAIEERKNYFSRFNTKSYCSQLLAANIDMVLCITSKNSPPFRPRFLDRVLVQADISEIPAAIICNKIDLDNDDILDINERLEDFRRIGYTVLEVSAKTKEGIEELRQLVSEKCSVLTGQSGVGKSSLLNVLFPGINIKTGNINEKFNRGSHTTTLSQMIVAGDTKIIDTPGIRLFDPDGIKADALILHMREFASLAGKCSYGLSCLHRTEPGCKIMEAVHAGVIHEDRYESFLRIYNGLKRNAK